MTRRLKKLFFNYIPFFLKTGILRNMPALFELLEIRPSSAIIMLTNRCNLRCVMCRQWKETDYTELTIEEWKKTITDLNKNGIKNVHFTGGEPLLYAGLGELVTYCSRSGLTTGITTNGLLLDQGKLKGLLTSGLRSIAISVDGLGASYDELRGVSGSFSGIKEALSLLSEAKKNRKINSYINFTLMKNTISNFKDVKDLADRLELPIAICLLDKSSFIFRLKENRDKFWIRNEEDFRMLEGLLAFVKEEKRKKPSSLIINSKGINYIKAYFRDPVQKNIPCLSSQDRIFIDAAGNLLGGCLSMGKFGNIKDATLARLQKDKKYKTAKKNMFYKKCSGCSCGYIFNLHYLPPFSSFQI